MLLMPRLIAKLGDYENMLKDNSTIYFNEKNELGFIYKFTSWVILLFMPLSTYVTPIEGITIGDTMLMLLLCVVLFDILVAKSGKNIMVPTPLFIFLLLIILHSCLNIMLMDNINDVKLLGLFRYLFYLCVVLIISHKYIKMEYFIKVYIILAAIFATYAIAQFISFKLFGYPILPPNLFGLPTVDYIDSINNVDNFNLYSNDIVVYRPRSVFLEPSYFAAFLSPILFYLLNYKTNIKLVVLLSLGILVSGSTTGFVFLIMFWIKFIPTLLINLKSGGGRLLFVIGSIFLVGYFFNNYFYIILDRIVSLDGSIGSSVVHRFENYIILSESFDDFMIFFLGHGMSSLEIYLPSYGVLFYKYGFLGVIIFLLTMGYSYYNCGVSGKMTVIIIVVLCLGTNSLFNISCVLLLTLIYSDSRRKDNIPIASVK